MARIIIRIFINSFLLLKKKMRYRYLVFVTLICLMIGVVSSACTINFPSPFQCQGAWSNLCSNDCASTTDYLTETNFPPVTGYTGRLKPTQITVDEFCKQYTNEVNSYALRVNVHNFCVGNDNKLVYWNGNSWIPSTVNAGTLNVQTILCATGCVPPCAPKTCSDFPGQCGKIDDRCEGLTEYCYCSDNTVCCKGICCSSGQVCDSSDTCCTPDCNGKVCGSDGCEGYCGSCNPTAPINPTQCIDGQCVDVGNPYWADMNQIDTAITTADLKDTVKLVLVAPGISIQGNELEYQIYKNNPFWFDTKLGQGTDTGFTTWLAGKSSDTGDFESGDYYFEVKVDSQTFESDLLSVSATEDNTPPTANITNPDDDATEEDLNFVIPSLATQTEVIPFTHNSQDSDDDLKITWDFGDSTQQEFSNCLTTENCNTEHQYSNSGTKIINLKAEEMLRTQSAIDRSRIFVYKEGYNIFAIIDSPDYQETFFKAGYYSIDGKSSYVAKCSFLECPEGGIGECYTPDSSSPLQCKKWANSDALTFEWTVDNQVQQEPTTDTPFDYLFYESGIHDIKLKVSYTY